MNMKQLASNLQEIFFKARKWIWHEKEFQTDHVNYVSSKQENLIISIHQNIKPKLGTLFLIVLSGAYFKHTFACFYLKERKK